MAKEAKEEEGKSGGIAYFLSLPFVLCLCVLHGRFIVLMWSSTNFLRVLCVAFGALFGIWLLHRGITKRSAVFLHELKHSILSNLVGNRAKGMMVKSRSGYFEYLYSKRTAHMNAFISLAPYWFPITTIAMLGITGPFVRHYPFLVTLLVGIAFGIDIGQQQRDLSPHQSDFSGLRGGYRFGLAYVVAMNAFVFTLLFIWAAQGWAGIGQLAAHYLEQGLEVAHYFYWRKAGP